MQLPTLKTTHCYKTQSTGTIIGLAFRESTIDWLQNNDNIEAYKLNYIAQKSIYELYLNYTHKSKLIHMKSQ